MAIELNGLPLESQPPLHCPDYEEPVGGSRSVLFLFGYRDAHQAAVLLEGNGCETVTNGRLAREGLKLPHGPDEPWPDEGTI
jgi:hypothetical protein